VHIAAALADVAHPVLVLPRWPYAEAVLPCADLLACLLAASRTLPRPAPEHLPSVLFVLDAKRNTPLRNRGPGDRRADNRYHSATLDLPDLRALRARGIQRIHRVSAA
jgi:hypothetical protein